MPPCVTSTMSVDNLNQVRDGNDTSAVSQSNNNNNSINNSNNNNNNNRVSSAVSAGNVSKIHTAKVTGESNDILIMLLSACVHAYVRNVDFLNARWSIYGFYIHKYQVDSLQTFFAYILQKKIFSLISI